MNKSWRKEDGLDKKGFTLIELIVTIGLLAILLAMIVPRMNTDRYYMEKISKEMYYRPCRRGPGSRRAGLKSA